MRHALKTDTPWRNSFFYCYFFERGFATPTTTSVRTRTSKLIKYPEHDDCTELFDLMADPYETKNLVNAPAYSVLRKLLELEYDKKLNRSRFRSADFADKPPADASLPNSGNIRRRSEAKKVERKSRLKCFATAGYRNHVREEIFVELTSVSTVSEVGHSHGDVPPLKVMFQLANRILVKIAQSN